MEGFLLGEREWKNGGWGLSASGARSSKREEKGKLMGGGQGSPFRKREPSECAQEVLLVTAPEDKSCPDLKGRPVQMPEY